MTKRWPNNWMKASMAGPTMLRKARRATKRGPGQSIVEGASLRLADEVRYIIRRAAAHDGRVVTIGQLTLFSTETGDAWIIDRDDHLALRLARDGPRTVPHRRNRHFLCDRLEGPLPHRRRSLRLQPPRHRPNHRYPRIPDR